MLRLDQAFPGEKHKICKLHASGPLRERMLALGLTRGAKIEIIRKGPGGDPTLYYIRGTMIALRKEEASLIQINIME